VVGLIIAIENGKGIFADAEQTAKIPLEYPAFYNPGYLSN